MKQFDTHSLDSHNPIHDSLMDLADDLGGSTNRVNDNENSFVIQDLESSPGQKLRSNSLPHIAVDTFDSTINGGEGSPSTVHQQNKRIQSTSDEKLQNRKLLVSWVKEQKKK